MLLTVIMAFAGAQTARAQVPEPKPCFVTFYITGSGTVVVGEETITNGQTLTAAVEIAEQFYMTLTPASGNVVSSATYSYKDQDGVTRTYGMNYDDYDGWNFTLRDELDPSDHTITVNIVFAVPLAGGADEASAVALTADVTDLADGWYKVESDLTIGHTVNLHGDTHITIATGATLTVNTSDDDGISGSSGSALTVSGEGTLAVSASERAISVYNYTQTGCAVTLSGDSNGLYAKNNISISGGSLTTSGAIYGIDTFYGAITISGGTVSSSGLGAGLFAGDAVSITGGTVSASGNLVNGIKGYSVSITGGQVTASSGGIWSSYGDITLGWTSATDYITASGFTLEDGFYVKIADGQKLYGGFPSASFTGTVGDPSALNGLMLRPTAAVTESGTNEYTILNAAGWDAFCDRLAADDGKAFFSGKTVYLGANIGTAQNPVTRAAGSDANPFCGTFDGQQHTLTADITETENQGTAPFRAISGATIRNLRVAGSVTGTAHAAGLVGFAKGDDAIVNTIENCLVETNVTVTTDDGNGHQHMGGVVGHAFNSTLNLTGVAFTGTMANNKNYAGGLQGWSDGNTLNITDCLFAGSYTGSVTNGFHPVALTNLPSKMTASVTSCYYTAAPTLNSDNYLAAQGKRLRSIEAGEGVTVEHAGVATEYSVSGITAYKSSDAHGDSDPFIEGILYDGVLYAGSGDAVSLALTNSGGEAPLGYKNGDYIITGGATLSGSTLIMSDADVTISFTPGALRSTGVAVTVSYIDEDGILCDGQDGRPDPASAIALDGTESTLNAGWYFVGADISHSGQIDLNGDVNIILADGKTMTVSGESDGIYGYSGSLTIYGQTLGTGTLDVTGSDYGICNDGGNVVIRGGTVNATGTYQNGIFANGNITITGGKVTATGSNGDGIFAANGNITLGCTNATDFIKASSYGFGPGKYMYIADGQTLYDEYGNEYSDDGVDFDKLAGKTLRPYDCRLALSDDADNTAAIAAANGKVYNVTLQGRTLYKDGAWNTLCLPFAIDDFDGTPLEGATVKELNATTSNLNNGTLTLNFSDNLTAIEAGTPYIVKWAKADGYDEADPETRDVKNPVFTGVTISGTEPTPVTFTGGSFVGQYSLFSIVANDAVLGENQGYLNEIIMLGSGNKLGYSQNPRTLHSFRAHFYVPANGGGQQARSFVLDFGEGEQTGILSTTNFTNFTNSAAAWYDMQGRKLQGQPTKKGLYIHGGKKVVIK